jgi:hypothetical protein
MKNPIGARGQQQTHLTILLTSCSKKVHKIREGNKMAWLGCWIEKLIRGLNFMAFPFSLNFIIYIYMYVSYMKNAFSCKSKCSVVFGFWIGTLLLVADVILYCEMMC